MSDVDLGMHLAQLAQHHGVEFDDEDLQPFSEAAQQGVGPEQMEELVAGYVAEVYEGGEDFEDEDDFEDDFTLDDDDEEADLQDDFSTQIEAIAGRVSATENHIGRKLTETELGQLASAVRDGQWDVEHISSQLGLKGFTQMSQDEETNWLSSRARELEREQELVAPFTDDGRPDWDAMSPDDQAKVMAARASGAEFADA